MSLTQIDRSRRNDVFRMLNYRHRHQLEQLRKAGVEGVPTRDLLDEPATDFLVSVGLAEVSPANLGRLYITPSGRHALAKLQADKPPALASQGKGTRGRNQGTSASRQTRPRSRGFGLR